MNSLYYNIWETLYHRDLHCISLKTLPQLHAANKSITEKREKFSRNLQVLRKNIEKYQQLLQNIHMTNLNLPMNEYINDLNWKEINIRNIDLNVQNELREQTKKNQKSKRITRSE